MAKLEVKLFGIPEIYVNQEEIKFSFKKADALFYYLLLVKKTTRDHLVNLFWADSDDAVAKKNLRNAIYIIKKTLGIEVFISPQRSMIEMNPKIEINLDIDDFNKNSENSVDYYRGSFLEGLHLKNCENYESWVVSQQQYFEGIFIQKSLAVAVRCLEDKRYNEVEKYCKKLIAIDPFDEEIYRMLMKSYFEAGRYDKSMNLYDELVKLLDEELSISPDILTIELYELIVHTRSMVKKSSKKEINRFFFGRENEVSLLYKNYFNYVKGNKYAHYLIQGEVGVGKSEVINELLIRLKEENVTAIRVYCYQPIAGFNLRSWDDLIEKLGTIVKDKNIIVPELIRLAIVSVFPSFGRRIVSKTSEKVNEEHIFRKKTIESAIYELIKIVTNEVKLLLIFEDIQWLDNPSLVMLKKLMNERYIQNPVVYITCRNAHNDNIEKFISEFAARDIIKKIQLERFSEFETNEFAKYYMSDEDISNNAVNAVYSETEGNALFMMEFLNSIKYDSEFGVLTTKIKSSLKNRLLNLSKGSMKLIQLASIYFEFFTVDEIVSISEKPEFEVLDMFEELENMYFIREKVNEAGEAVYEFTHKKIKEYIYDSMSLSKRKILHIRVAKKAEEKLFLEPSRGVYSLIIYHYLKAKNHHKVLEYRIKNLYEYLQSSHEVFPIIKERDIFNHESIFFTEEEIQEEFLKIEKLLFEFGNVGSNTELCKLKLIFKHMTGRHYINNGFYDKGLVAISEVIELAKKSNNVEYLIKGYLQNIFYSINTHNMELMNINITTALNIAYEESMKYEIGILLRLKGLYLVLKSNFKEGEELLLSSIEIMKDFKEKDKYALNVAAAYYYMGDSNRFKGNFVESISYYEKAIEICENNDLLGRLTLFYTNAGHSAYNLCEYQISQRYFESAIRLYEELDFPWRRSIAYGFLGLLEVRKGKYDKALTKFLLADKYSSKMNNPYELAVVCRIKAELELMLLEGNIFSMKLETFIESEDIDYIEEGIEYLKNFKHCYEMRRLIELRMKRQIL